MCKYFNNKIRSLFVISLLFFYHSAYAVNCYEKSPNLVNLGDEYYNLDKTVKFTNVEWGKVEDFYKSMKGKWSGRIQHIECMGPDRAPRQKVSNITVDANININSKDEYFIQAGMTVTATEILKNIKYYLPPKDRIFELEFKGANDILISEKQRKNIIGSKAGGGSRLIENIYQIKKSGNSMTLNITYYSNGVLVATDEWSLAAK